MSSRMASQSMGLRSWIARFALYTYGRRTASAPKYKFRNACSASPGGYRASCMRASMLSYVVWFGWSTSTPALKTSLKLVLPVHVRDHTEREGNVEQLVKVLTREGVRVDVDDAVDPQEVVEGPEVELGVLIDEAVADARAVVRWRDALKLAGALQPRMPELCDEYVDVLCGVPCLAHSCGP